MLAVLLVDYNAAMLLYDAMNNPIDDGLYKLNCVPTDGAIINDVMISLKVDGILHDITQNVNTSSHLMIHWGFPYSL